MPLLKHDCRWRERMKLNQIRKLKKGVWCPVHILTMETSHKKFSSFTKVFKSAPLFSKQENCKCPSSTASISRLYPCLWVFPNNLMVSKYCQLVISSSCYLCLWAMSKVVNDVNGRWAIGNRVWSRPLKDIAQIINIAEQCSWQTCIQIFLYHSIQVWTFKTSGWKWMKEDENGWK